jgi:tRNA threonylcarbamoyladenosine biosynthesis protein TsaE
VPIRLVGAPRAQLQPAPLNAAMPSPDCTPHQAPAMVRLDLPDLDATTRLADRLARLAARGDTIALAGALGTGKTTFARAFIRARARLEDAPPPAEVPSPTFTLLQVYDLPGVPVWHFDLYRLAAPDEAWELGIEEAFAGAIALIEWPERLGALLPAERLEVRLRFMPQSPDARRARLGGYGGWSERLREARLGE